MPGFPGVVLIPRWEDSAWQVTNDTVGFGDGTNFLCSSTVSASGIALFKTSSLSVGTDEITALYVGTATYYPGTEEAHTNPTRQRGECLRALAGASG